MRLKIALLFVFMFSQTAFAEKLPVFRLGNPAVNLDSKAVDILVNLGERRAAFSRDEGFKDREDALVYRGLEKEIEIYKASGGMYMRDVNQLQNPRVKPNLPSKSRARIIADKFLEDNNLILESEFVKISFAGYSETGISNDSSKGNPVKAPKKTLLDIQVNYKTELVLTDAAGEKRIYPVVGGGSDFKVTIGDKGNIIGYEGGSRVIEGIESTEEILSQESARAELQQRFGDTKVSEISSSLAYYLAPRFEEQQYLYPVWVVKAKIDRQGSEMPVRNVIVAATKYGYDKFAPGTVSGRDVVDKMRLQEFLNNELESQTEAFLQQRYIASAGTSWIGVSQGLSGSQLNAQGFVDELAAAGWTIKFNWGDWSAWESDWNRNDDIWVDSVDFVFYTGHADKNGWALYAPDDNSLHYSEVGTQPGSPNDLYGQNNLEWLIIAACGPHQSNHFTSGAGNVFDRWRGIFDKLHVFMGYGAITYDNTDEGKRVIQLAKAGWPIISAWFRTAQEIQPSSNGSSAPNGPTIYVTAMYAHSGDYATYYDHIWGTGNTVSDPPITGQYRTFMWSGT
jgi:hypothetical protein